MIVIAIVITGSLFIMYTANHRMMPSMTLNVSTPEQLIRAKIGIMTCPMLHSA